MKRACSEWYEASRPRLDGNTPALLAWEHRPLRPLAPQKFRRQLASRSQQPHYDAPSVLKKEVRLVGLRAAVAPELVAAPLVALPQPWFNFCLLVILDLTNGKVVVDVLFFLLLIMILFARIWILTQPLVPLDEALRLWRAVWDDLVWLISLHGLNFF